MTVTPALPSLALAHEQGGDVALLSEEKSLQSAVQHVDLWRRRTHHVLGHDNSKQERVTLCSVQILSSTFLYICWAVCLTPGVPMTEQSQLLTTKESPSTAAKRSVYMSNSVIRRQCFCVAACQSA